jgi:hypothetical protein
VPLLRGSSGVASGDRIVPVLEPLRSSAAVLTVAVKRY